MIAKAEGKYIRVSASKVRLVLDLLKGKTVEQAHFILDNVNKGAAIPVRKVLVSAFSNANNNRQEKFLSKDLYICGLRADVGPMLVRYRAATMGRATPVRHRTAHIRVELDQIKQSEPKKNKRVKSKDKK